MSRQSLVYSQSNCELLSFHDITPLIKSQELKQQNNLLNRMTAGASHEVMTPLSCVITFAENICKRSEEVSTQKSAKSIKITATLLKSHMRDMLDRSILEHRKLKLNLEPSRLRTCLQQVKEIMQYPAEHKEVKLKLIAENSDMAQEMMLDASRLTQVLFNLTSNAIKFSAHGQSVRIYLGLDPLPDNHVLVRIQVRDEG